MAAVWTSGSASSSGQLEIRVDQLGYARSEHKLAYLLAPHALDSSTSFVVTDANGREALTGRVGPSRGVWNGAYGAVQPLDLSRLQAIGTYRIRVRSAVSPPFRVAASRTLFLPRVSDVAAFFQAQRDGADVVPGPLHRRPAHLADAQASVYAVPPFKSPDSDVIGAAALHRIGGPVDVSGGWVDAGDFLKFAHTTAYADTLLLIAERQLGTLAPEPLAAEGRFGLGWLRKVWDARTGVLYAQVGIGSGNDAGSFYGDHDLWRLPEHDDSMTGSKARYLRSRPLFRANAPGAPLPPNLAGRIAAAFAVAAQLDAGSRPSSAGRELATAATLFSRAKVNMVRRADVVTAFPHSYYPESVWQDDLALAGAELAIAGRRLHDPRASAWLRRGAYWADVYARDVSDKDTLNLYDVATLADLELARAGSRARLARVRLTLLRAQSRAARDPFDAAVKYDDFDAASRTFGLVAIARLYAELTGDHSDDAFATAQRDWALGANAWGISLMIGVGTTFPHCPQHVVGNLSGSLDGRPPILRGAVVNGPNAASIFQGGLDGLLDGMRRCPVHGGEAFARFTGRGSRYVDDVRAWQTDEPAIDFTATAALAFAASS